MLIPSDNVKFRNLTQYQCMFNAIWIETLRACIFRAYFKLGRGVSEVK